VAPIGISNGESDLIDRALAWPAERHLKISQDAHDDSQNCARLQFM